MPNPYSVLGTTVPAMLGRQKDWRRALLELNKPTPNNLSIYGPKYIGKTVLLNQLHQHFQENGEPFVACLYWHLRDDQFEGDEGFFARFADRLASVLQGVDALAADTARTKSPTAYEAIREVGTYLQGNGQKILVILDHFDHLPGMPGLTQNVYTSLRKLAELYSLCFVIGSRKDLDEYVGDIGDSGLPNVFTKRRLLRAFEMDDIRAVVAPLQERGLSFTNGALTVLHKETGGIPLLLMCVCSQLWEEAEAEGTPIDHERVQNCIEQQSDALDRYLKKLWRACTEKERLDLSRLAGDQALIQGETIYGPRAEALEKQGLVQINNRRVEMHCRLMERYAADHREAPALLHQLFGDEEDFNTNIRGVIEHRLEQVENGDSDLVATIQTALDAEAPAVTLGLMRQVTIRAMHLVLEIACPDGEVPEAWVREWQHKGLTRYPEGPVSEDNGDRIWLLSMAADHRNKIHLPIGRDTFELIQFLHRIGNIKSHEYRADISRGFVASVCLNAIELCARLAQELPVRSRANAA